MNGTRSVHGAIFAIVAWTLLPLFSPVSAQVEERRHSSANPVVEIFKSTVYGAGAGLVVGLAIELIEDQDGEAIRWGFVGGTFLGMGYGIYHVATRPGPTGAFLEGDMDGFAFGVPRPEVLARGPDPVGRALAGPTAGSNRSWEIRAPVLALRF